MPYVKISSKKELEDVINKEEKSVVMVAGSFCPPCRKYTPIFEKEGNESDLKFVKIEVDLAPDANELVEVSSVPTIILFKNGKEVHREIGPVDPTTLKSLISSKLG